RGEDGFRPDTGEICRLIEKHHPRAVFLCNPNNPTGVYLPRSDIEKILSPSKDSLLIIDEAYVNFVPERWPSASLITRNNIIILRSMTKDYGIPGLRLGYCLASPEIISGLYTALPPWNVNAIAQKAGVFLLGQEAHLCESLHMVSEAKRYLISELARLGIAAVPSATHYFLIRANDAPSLRSALLKDGILVRDCSSFGLADYLRISQRSLRECTRLIQALEPIRAAHPALLDNHPRESYTVGGKDIQRGPA
ncbi:MAG: histidinol-phosphate aminotransferase family protein, partial [Dehalococcoidales bacterium]|nr:histidinol-phosphate aminotransferase family protein [Dehalococcoidales bacterium]